jgi:hypothetical protein
MREWGYRLSKVTREKVSQKEYSDRNRSEWREKVKNQESSEQKEGRRCRHGCEKEGSLLGDAGEGRARTDNESETLILRAAGSDCGSERMQWSARRMERGGCCCGRSRRHSLNIVERDCLRFYGG